MNSSTEVCSVRLRRAISCSSWISNQARLWSFVSASCSACQRSSSSSMRREEMSRNATTEPSRAPSMSIGYTVHSTGTARLATVQNAVCQAGTWLPFA